ncbi:MAP protein kinase [Trypanosoma theileri]|uniref:MAP protein kinase n=1 Tax=Trypanosoma theileri TaxID=67003 RepID=A0A1X0NUN4_9TRYP|nr:MAP protein kinase [Trypanosoma theileri]ORC88416.1 MAP protein kinase [Trypanosoma theileri]
MFHNVVEAVEHPVLESEEDVVASQRTKKNGCRISTMVLIAVVMSFGVLIVGLIGFLPMYFVGFHAAGRATRLIRTQAINGLLTTTNNSLLQLPNLINCVSSNYIIAEWNNNTFFPENKTKLLFALANILSKEIYRDIISYFLVVSAEPPNKEWGVLVAAYFGEGTIGGAVLDGMRPAPIYQINPVTVDYSVPLQTLASYNMSLYSTLTRSDGPYMSIVLPWNESRSHGVPWRKRWFSEGINFSSMYFDYVVPFGAENHLGFWEVAMLTAAFDKGTVRLLWRALRENGRAMVIDPIKDIVVSNNWMQPSITRENINGKNVVTPLKINDVNDSLMMMTLNKVRSRGGFTEFMKNRRRKEFRFSYQGDSAHTIVVRFVDVLGLDLLLCITTLQGDFFREVFLARTIVATITALSVLLVALFAAVIAYFTIKPLRRLVPALERASNLQLRGDDDDEGGYTGNDGSVLVKSRIAEVQEVQDGYAELTRQLRMVKSFVPEAILAAPTGISDRVSHKRRRESPKKTHVQSAKSQSGVTRETEIIEQNRLFRFRQDMRLNSSIFKERTNKFVRRYCTMVLIEDTQPSSLDTYFHNILACAAELNGCVEYMRPDGTFVSFGAHSPLPLHSIKGCRFAFALFDRLTPQEKETITILVDSDEFLVGTYGAHSRNARVVVGLARLRELTKVANRLGCRIAATAGTASQLQENQVFPVDCVMLSSSTIPVVISELRPQSSSQNTIRTSKHFRLGLAAMRRGSYKEAITHYQRIGNSDPQAQRLIKICEQRCYQNDSRSYVLVSKELLKNSILDVTIPTIDALAAETAAPSNRNDYTGTLQKHCGTPATLLQNNAESGAGSGCNDDPLFEMYKLSTKSSESIESLADGCNGADDVPISLTDMNHKVWIRSLKKISEGAFSTVFLGMSEDGVQVAIKCIPRRRRDIMQESLEAEMNVASKLRHPNIVQYVSCSVVQSHLAIIMEYVPGGSLHTVIKNFGRVTPLVARRFTVDILNGLNYLHGLGIVHCDVKPHNVLLGMDGVCKLSDFGSTISEAADMARTAVDEMTLRGTALYMAPEVARGGRCTPQSDIFSLGISLLEMLLGRLPWRWSSTAPEGSDAAALHTLLHRDTLFVQNLSRGYLEPEVPDSLDREVALFVRACCNPDPSMRPSALGLLSYAFIL